MNLLWKENKIRPQASKFPIELRARETVYRIITEFGPPMWQAEGDTELTLSDTVGQILLNMAKFC